MTARSFYVLDFFTSYLMTWLPGIIIDPILLSDDTQSPSTPLSPRVSVAYFKIILSSLSTHSNRPVNARPSEIVTRTVDPICSRITCTDFRVSIFFSVEDILHDVYTPDTGTLHTKTTGRRVAFQLKLSTSRAFFAYSKQLESTLSILYSY